MKKSKTKKLITVIVCLLAAVCIALGVLAAYYRDFKSCSVYQSVDSGKSGLFSGKKVLVVVPHQDDDLNVMGGVFEEFIKYGSQVKVLFVTAGDFSAHPGVRMGEAIEVLTLCGIPEDDIIFLGYPDTGLFAPIKNIYNYPEDEVVNYFGTIDSTYALENHPAYNDGNTYTRRHLCEDLYSAITDFMPDILVCNDYDEHPDHRAASLFFDETMGNVLKDNPGYEPVVLKTFAYSYTFYGYDDFYDSINILSTRKTCDTPYLTETNIFNWDERIRLPLSAETLSRCLDTSKIFKEEALYVSQNAQANCGRVINGDRVFFLRETGSVILNSDIETSSGNASLLNDYKLIDSSDVTVQDMLPTEGTWIPVDSEKQADITLGEKTDIRRICLYDNPSLEDNILDALITFDDGTQIHTGRLEPTGCATEIEVNHKNTESFSVRILSSEGSRAGLTEIEAYTLDKAPVLSYFKITDRDGNFVYDYYTDGSDDFMLYAYGCSADLGDYDVDCSGDGCSCTAEEGRITVTCPRNMSCILTVSAKDGSCSDSVAISNPGTAIRTGWAVEAWAYRHNYPWRNNFIYSALKGKR